VIDALRWLKKKKRASARAPPLALFSFVFFHGVDSIARHPFSLTLSASKPRFPPKKTSSASTTPAFGAAPAATPSSAAPSAFGAPAAAAGIQPAFGGFGEFFENDFLFLSFFLQKKNS